MSTGLQPWEKSPSLLQIAQWEIELCPSIVSDTTEKILAAKELAVTANIIAVNDLSHTEDFSEKLLNTSSALFKVNETLQKTNELIIDSSKAGKLAASLLSGNVIACKSAVNV